MSLDRADTPGYSVEYRLDMVQVFICIAATYALIS